MSKEQLAGLVEEIGDELEMAGYGAVTQLPTESLRDWHERLAAILATLPEPGVVTDEVARVAVNAYDRATGEGWQMPCVQGMRSALEAALPYLAPAAPAGEVVVTRAGSSDGPIVAVTRQDGEGRVLSTIATYEPAPAAQGGPAQSADAAMWGRGIPTPPRPARSPPGCSRPPEGRHPSARAADPRPARPARSLR